MQIVLIRHPPALVAPGTCYGRLDAKLRPGAAGIIVGIAARVRGAGRVITSPARRCRAVAAAIAGGAMEEDARLLELDFGRWEGLPWSEVPRAELDAWARDPLGFAPPGGETGTALVARVAAFYAELVARDADCVVVSHGGPLKVLAPLLRGETPELLAPPPLLGSVTKIRC